MPKQRILDGFSRGPRWLFDSKNTLDVFTPSYLAFSISIYLFLWLSADLDRIFHLRVMILPFLAFPMLLWLIFFTRTIFIAIQRNHWRRVISIIVAPVAVLLLRLELMSAHITPEFLQFEICKFYYEKESLKITPLDGLPRIKVWDWGEIGGVAAPSIIYILIYDDSDQIALPYFDRSQKWTAAAESVARGNAFYSIIHPESYSNNIAFYLSQVTVTHFSGHFYLISELL